MGTPQACRGIRADPPDSTWVAGIDPDTGTALWGIHDENSPVIAAGQSREGFRLVLGREGSCCFDFESVGPFDGDPLQRYCFECAFPVPVQRRTWGQVKQIYR